MKEDDREALMKINSVLCHIFYLPTMITVILYFLIVDCFLVPVAYVTNTARLFSAIFIQESFNGVKKRIFLFLQFFLLGLIILPVSVLTDTFIFIMNLFTIP